MMQVDSVADTDDEGDGVGDIGVIDDDGGGGFTSGSSQQDAPRERR